MEFVTVGDAKHMLREVLPAAMQAGFPKNKNQVIRIQTGQLRKAILSEQPKTSQSLGELSEDTMLSEEAKLLCQQIHLTYKNSSK